MQTHLGTVYIASLADIDYKRCMFGLLKELRTMAKLASAVT